MSKLNKHGLSCVCVCVYVSVTSIFIKSFRKATDTAVQNTLTDNKQQPRTILLDSITAGNYHTHTRVHTHAIMNTGFHKQVKK